MKKSSIIYIISIAISICAIIAAIIVATKFAIPNWIIHLGIILYTPFCLLQIALLFGSIENKHQKENVIKEVTPTDISNAETSNENVSLNADDNSIHEKWAKAMYERFGEEWTDIFSRATYPANKSTRAEICVELWKIASLTMDYLFVVNDDPNVLKRNKEMTNAVIEGLNLTSEVELKEFYEDPTSVQQKVLIINDLLTSQLATKQSFDVAVFGYKVELGTKK